MADVRETFRMKLNDCHCGPLVQVLAHNLAADNDEAAIIFAVMGKARKRVSAFETCESQSLDPSIGQGQHLPRVLVLVQGSSLKSRLWHRVQLPSTSTPLRPTMTSHASLTLSLQQ
jgi:hypothetical protein